MATTEHTKSPKINDESWLIWTPLMEVVQCHYTCLSRQVHEAVRILRTDAEIIINSESEFHQTLIRVLATNGLQEEQTSAVSQGVGAAGERASQGRRARGPGRSRGGHSAATGGKSVQGRTTMRGRGDYCRF